MDEIIKKFDEKFTDHGNGWSSVWVYRDNGKIIIEELKTFLRQHCLSKEEVRGKIKNQINYKCFDGYDGDPEIECAKNMNTKLFALLKSLGLEK